MVQTGKVSRFVGSGTGSIDHDDAIQHVKKLGIPRVSLSLNPSNGVIRRSLYDNSEVIIDRETAKNYFAQQPGVDTFILRRSKILDFVYDQDADRYQKFIRLLGISNVDNLQRSFVDAEKQAKDGAQRAKDACMKKLSVFKDPVADFEPQNLNQIFVCNSDSINLFKLEKLSQWSDTKNRLSLLKAMRPESNKEKIDLLTRALVSLETPLPLDIGADIKTANTLRQKLAELISSSVDAPRIKIINEGLDYLKKHVAQENCPLCEKLFEQTLPEILSRLKQRSDAQRELSEVITNRRATLGRIQRYAETTAAQLHKDLEHATLLHSGTKQTLRDIRASTLWWLRSLKNEGADENNSDLVSPPCLSALEKIRIACTENLKREKTALVQSDSSKLEAAIALLERGIVSHSEITSAENVISVTKELARRAMVAKNAFSEAREIAIQKVFDHIANTVLDFYRRLHDFDEQNERSECTALELKSTTRAAAGGLRLAIQFLGLTKSKDPRAFFSEGHLDSLGLCLFLAAVHIFNPTGSLLVLDDVLTSIDKKHRRRVGELLLREFSSYQIILTTHDEYWRDLLRSSARSWGIQGKWVFMEIEDWTIDSGSILSVLDSSWEYVLAHLTETEYRELGGSFRFILEDFLKRTAEKLELKVKFKIDRKYTAGDFVNAGIQDKIRDTLIKLAPDTETDICTNVGRVFGQGDLEKWTPEKRQSHK